MNGKEKVIDLIKHKESKDHTEFEETKKSIMYSIFDDITPRLFELYPIFKELTEEQMFAIKADICGSAVGYMMGSLDKYKQEFESEPLKLIDYLEGILKETKK